MGCYYRSLLTQGQKKIYQTLLGAMGNYAIPCDGDVADIGAAMKAMLLDHPRLCFFEGKWAWETGIVYPQYVLPGQALRDLDRAAQNISGQFAPENYPKQVYDWMLQRIAYCPEAQNSQNAYGALVEHRAVCKGIAKGYQLLMERKGIRCLLVEGTLDGKAKHVWNLIEHEGQWRHVDVTMGYPCFWYLTGSADANGGFRKTTEELSGSHRIYHPEYLPAER